MSKSNKKRKYCMYCKEKDGTINHDVFIEVKDFELGPGWLCKECFLQSVKEEREMFEELQQKKELLENKLFRMTSNFVTINVMFFICGVVVSFILIDMIQFFK